MMKRNFSCILSVVMAMVMILSAVPMTAGAAEIVASGECGDNVYWSLDDEGTLTLSGSGEMWNYDYDDHAPWYSMYKDITTIIIEGGITTIGSYAFYMLSYVTSVSIPDGVTKIGAQAFNRCTRLESVNIPDTVTWIGNSFSDCEKLSQITIPASVEYLGSSPFSGCSALQRIDVDPGNSNYSSDGSGVLYDKDKTTLIRYPRKNKQKEFEISNGVEIISGGAFSNNAYLEKLIMPTSITTIESAAFYACSKLTDISFSSNLKKIGMGIVDRSAFSNNADNWEDGVLYAGSYLLAVKDDVGGTYYVKDGTTVISDLAFSSKVGFSEVIFPDSVKVLGESTFFINDHIRKVVIGSGVTVIEESMFDNCSNLESVTFTKNVTKIEYGAFGQWTSLSAIYYNGSKEDWEKIKVGADNDRLESAKIHYNYTPVEICDRWFDTNLDYYTTYWDSTSYNANLSNMLICLANAVYDEKKIVETYTALGFDTCEKYGYNNTEADKITYTMGFKKSDYSDETICLIAVRGSNNTADWIGNFAIQTEDEKHMGFSYPANDIYYEIQKSNQISGNVKYVITGHSRGAAVANLLAVKLQEEGVNSGNIYNYNFACPDVACKTSFPEYDNIFNLCNREDPVPFLPGTLASAFTTPGTSWGKYGQTYWFTKDAEGTIDPKDDHSQELYLEFFDKRQNPDEWGTSFWDKVDDANLQATGWVTKILCPVDVIITNIEGNTIASVIDGKVNYYDSYFSDIIILTDGDKKVIYCNGDRNFNVELIGTDDGEMTYSVEKFDYVSGESFESKTFEKVKLEAGKEMYSPVSVADETENIKLFVVETQNGEEIHSFEINTDGSETELAHIYKPMIQNPTCTEKGFTIYSCSCGDSYIDNITDVIAHTDNNGDSCCDFCSKILVHENKPDTDNCSHMCHKSGFMSFIWKIVQFFWRLFGMNPVCECGAAHY